MNKSSHPTSSQGKKIGRQPHRGSQASSLPHNPEGYNQYTGSRSSSRSQESPHSKRRGMQDRDEYGRFEPQDRYARSGFREEMEGRGHRHPSFQERGPYGRFESRDRNYGSEDRGDDYRQERGGYRSLTRDRYASSERERDDDGRFLSDRRERMQDGRDQEIGYEDRYEDENDRYEASFEYRDEEEPRDFSGGGRNKGRGRNREREE